MLGFQEFMNRVDADRLKLMPPTTFEKYLAFAMALGVEHHWAQAFAGIVKDPPTWYVGPGGGYGSGFNPIFFSSSMHSMAGDMTRCLSPLRAPVPVALDLVEAAVAEADFPAVDWRRRRQRLLREAMMRSVCTLVLLLALVAVASFAQQSEAAQPSLTVHSTLVMVPVLVTTKAGKVVFELTADDFLVTDNGVPQKVALNPDTDSQPLALAIVVETGGAGARHLNDYRQLDSILEALIGNVAHRVTLIGFDSATASARAFHAGNVSRCPATLQPERRRSRRGDPGCGGLRGGAAADRTGELPARNFAAQRNH